MPASHRQWLAALASVSLCLVVLPIGVAHAQNTVSGSFKGNGKPAALTQVTTHKGEPESGQPVTVLVFSSKDQSKSPKPASDAIFGKLGDAVVIKVLPDGTVYSGDLVHSALSSPSGSITVFGVLTITEFATTGGDISGHLTSGGPHTSRDQTFDVDLAFRAKAP